MQELVDLAVDPHLDDTAFRIEASKFEVIDTSKWGRVDVTPDSARNKVRDLSGPPGPATTSPLPLTPRAEQVTGAHTFREVDAEHLLLELLRDGEGVGAQVLVEAFPT